MVFFYLNFDCYSVFCMFCMITTHTFLFYHAHLFLFILKWITIEFGEQKIYIFWLFNIMTPCRTDLKYGKL